MHDSVFVCMPHCIQELPEQWPCLGPGDWTRLLSNDFGELASLNFLHNEGQVPAIDNEIVDFHDAGMVELQA